MLSLWLLPCLQYTVDVHNSVEIKPHIINDAHGRTPRSEMDLSKGLDTVRKGTEMALRGKHKIRDTTSTSGQHRFGARSGKGNTVRRLLTLTLCCPHLSRSPYPVVEPQHSTQPHALVHPIHRYLACRYLVAIRVVHRPRHRAVGSSVECR